MCAASFSSFNALYLYRRILFRIKCAFVLSMNRIVMFGLTRRIDRSQLIIDEERENSIEYYYYSIETLLKRTFRLEQLDKLVKTNTSFVCLEMCH